MTTQNDINKDMVSLLSSIHDRIQELKNEVVALRLDMDSQHVRNDNFNDRLINLMRGYTETPTKPPPKKQKGVK